jgi:SNF2 family DNA or RNA helicase
MLHISLKDKKKLLVTLDQKDPNYSKVYQVVRSLLTARESGVNTWVIGYDDFIQLKERLDKLGLTSGRTLSDEAFDFLSWIDGEEDKKISTKLGQYNEEIYLKIKDKIGVELYEDQISAVSYLVRNKRSGLFYPMGTGKTVITLSVLAYLDKEVTKTLVVCPKTVMMGYAREIEKYTDFKYISIPSGNRTKALDYFRKKIDDDWKICLVHPENLVGSGKAVSNDLSVLLKTVPFDMIIVDEFHQYKNISTKRTKNVIALMDEIRTKKKEYSRAVVMTGTPISESPLNAYSFLRIVGYDRLPHVNRFENYFTITKDCNFSGRSFKKVVGYKNLSDLKGRLDRYSIHKTKDSLKGFPDKMEQIREIELSGTQLSLYKAICGELVEELPKTTKINLAGLLNSCNALVRLRQVLTHPALLEEEGNSVKYEELDSVVEEVLSDPEAKLLVWTEFRKSVDLLYERYNKDYGAVKIYGGVENNQLAKIATDFEGSGGPRIAVCIPAKAGTGVDFLARARTAVYVDRPFSYVLYRQSLDRIHRRVKTSGVLSDLDRIRSQPATIIFLDVANSIDELIRDKLNMKGDLVSVLTEANERLVEIGRDDLLRYLM